MTFIFSIISLAVLLIVLSKFITKHLHLDKADKILGKIHCKLGYLLVISATIHMLFSFYVFNSRPVYLYLLGILMLVCILVTAISYWCRKSLKKNWLIIHRLAALILCLLLLSHVGMYFYSVISYQRNVSSIEITEIDVGKIPDGTYIGECDVKYIYAKVNVTVSNGKITSIDLLEHRNEKGAAAESIVNDVIENQKIDVDTISGATNSSKVIKKAIENALADCQKTT